MKAIFIEDEDLKLGLQFEPETDDERLLLRAFYAQSNAHHNMMLIQGVGVGGPNPGYRHIKLYHYKMETLMCTSDTHVGPLHKMVCQTCLADLSQGPKEEPFSQHRSKRSTPACMLDLNNKIELPSQVLGALNARAGQYVYFVPDRDNGEQCWRMMSEAAMDAYLGGAGNLTAAFLNPEDPGFNDQQRAGCGVALDAPAALDWIAEGRARVHYEASKQFPQGRRFLQRGQKS